MTLQQSLMLCQCECIVQTWYVCCAAEACLCVSWWAFSSRFTSRGIVPASLSGAWLAGHSARFLIRPTVAYRGDRDQRCLSIWVIFKGNFTCGASIWQRVPPLEPSVNLVHCPHVYQTVCDALYQRKTRGMRGKRSNNFLWMENSLSLSAEETAGPTSTRVQRCLWARPATCLEKLWFDS